MQNWSVSVYGKNLTEEEEVGEPLDVAVLFVFVGVRPPRIFGLELTY